ncbi:MAG: CTP synthase [Dokdonella sp.]
MPALRIGLIGDRDEDIAAHHAIPLALGFAAANCAVDVDVAWIATDSVGSARDLAHLDGLWCVPGSPYRNMDGALTAIRYAREENVPFMGTCGGFQHSVVEYARNVLGWRDADHAESSPDAPRAVIVPLSCALVEVRDGVHLVEGSRIREAYGADRIDEAYHCRFGLSADFREAIANGSLRVTGTDDKGDARAIELDGHRFFVATLFQHERVALVGACPPLARAFVDAIATRVRATAAA